MKVWVAVLGLCLLLFYPQQVFSQTTNDSLEHDPWFIAAKEVHPTSIHEAAYKMMESCTGIKGNFDNVVWVIADGIYDGPDDPHDLYEQRQFDLLEERRLVGLWLWGWKNSDRLTEMYFPNVDSTKHVLVIDRRAWWNLYVVTHEILHSLYSGEIPLIVHNRCVLKI